MTSWKRELLSQFTSLEKLVDFLELDSFQKEKILNRPPFPLKLPRRLAEKIQKATLDDPILKQFLPLNSELIKTPGFSLEPVEDSSFRKGSKLLHKYYDRALLLVSSACAMHCRFCFRQNFPYEKEVSDFSEELAYINNHPELAEIILSGGDPLSVTNEKLSDLLVYLDQVPHVKRIRFHTRFPIGVPERIDAGFLELLERSQKQIYFVIHVNHQNELDQDILQAMKKIQKLGVPVLSQTVLLKGVNDSLNELEALFTELVNHGITPYYLHQLDLVQGAQEFKVEKEKGLELMKGLTERLSGYAIPKYVEEIAGEKSKTAVGFLGSPPLSDKLMPPLLKVP